MEYTVARIRAPTEPRLVSLHKTLIRTGPALSRSYLRWKYEENPFITEPVMHVVLFGDEVVGMRGLFGTAWDLGDGSGTAVLPHADDLIVHPEHRNRGLFILLNQSTLDDAAERGFPTVLSLCGGDVTQRLQLAAGWKPLGDLERWYRAATPRSSSPTSNGKSAIRLQSARILKGVGRRLGFSRSSFLSNRSVDERLNAIARRASRPVSVSREAELSAMAGLAESTPTTDPRAPRTEDFLRWRLSNPHRRYRFVYWMDSRLRGFMVLSWKGRNPRKISIAEYAAEDIGVLRDLLRAVCAPLDHEYRVMSSSLLPADRAEFRRAGFTGDPSFMKEQRRQFLFFPLLPDGAEVLRPFEAIPYPTGWRLSLLDTMGA